MNWNGKPRREPSYSRSADYDPSEDSDKEREAYEVPGLSPEVSTTSRVVTSHMAPSEIISLLMSWGCRNLTSHINSAHCSEYPVGTGGFGDVHFGTLTNGTQVAIKAIRLHSADGLSPGKYQKRAARELHAWSKCHHRNVARLLGFSEFRGRLAMISEWAEYGNVTAYLIRKPSADRCSLNLDISRGLVYLHSQNIVHGDLKGANVLVSGRGEPMLTDFGNASLVGSTVSFTTTANNSFSIRWTAPEILRDSSPVSRAGDIYALGMTFLEIITGQVPFHQVPERTIYPAVVNKRRFPARPEDKIPPQSVCGDLLWGLLKQCWARQPRLRPSAAQVEHIMMAITQEALLYIEPEPESEDEF